MELFGFDEFHTEIFAAGMGGDAGNEFVFAAFDLAGFESVDVHMTDLLAGRVDLAGFAGVVAAPSGLV